MVSQLELNSRAGLCKQLAKREPANRALWMAEAGNWSRLSEERPRGAELPQIDSRMLASLQAFSARLRLEPAAGKHCMVGSLAQILTFPTPPPNFSLVLSH